MHLTPINALWAWRWYYTPSSQSLSVESLQGDDRSAKKKAGKLKRGSLLYLEREMKGEAGGESLERESEHPPLSRPQGSTTCHASTLNMSNILLFRDNWLLASNTIKGKQTGSNLFRGSSNFSRDELDCWDCTIPLHIAIAWAVFLGHHFKVPGSHSCSSDYLF